MVIVSGNKPENGKVTKDRMLHMNELIHHLNNIENSDARIILLRRKGEARAMK